MSARTSFILAAQDHENLRVVIEEKWTKACLARDWDGVLAMCAPDIVYMPSEHPVLKGHAELRSFFGNFPRMLKFSQPVEEMSGDSEIAIARATFAVTVELNGKPVETVGKVLCWFKKEPLGVWLVKAVCWNWDRPLSAFV